MKNILKFFLFLALIVNVSCNSDQNEEYGKGYNSGWIEMAGYDHDNNTDTAAVFETTINHDEMINIPVMLNSGTNVNGIKVTYKITLEDDSFLDDMSILGERTFMIDKDKKIGNIEFTPVLSSGIYKLKFTLLKTDDAQFQVGLSDDSKPIDFVLTVTNNYNYDAQPDAFSSVAPAYVAKIAQIGGTTNQFSVNSAWGPNFVAWATTNSSYEGLYLNAATITVNNDNTLTINGEYIDDAGSSGTFNPATGIYDVTFVQANLFGSAFTVHNVFTPQE